MNLTLLPKGELSSIEPNKCAIELIKSQIVDHVTQTGESPLELLVKSEAVVQIIQGIRADLKELVLDELSKYPGGKAAVL